MTTAELVERFVARHGGHKALGTKRQATIICRTHGPFSQLPNNHLGFRRIFRKENNFGAGAFVARVLDGHDAVLGQRGTVRRRRAGNASARPPES
ncbi:hypothetical protein [Caballeronia glebae]|uniref:hypothetical protein n=1 Tax=Caballeronia glebae TaxID=1777143 RepID=UPI0038BE190C